MTHAPVTQRKAALEFHGTVTASKPPSASSWRPMPRPTGGTPRRCCGHASREWGSMRTRHATALLNCAEASDVPAAPPASRPARCWHWSVKGLPNCVSARPQPLQSQVGGAGARGRERCRRRGRSQGASAARPPQRLSRRPARRPRAATLQLRHRPRLYRGQQRHLCQSHPLRLLPTPRRSQSQRPLQLPLQPPRPLPRRPR